MGKLRVNSNSGMTSWTRKELNRQHIPDKNHLPPSPWNKGGCDLWLLPINSTNTVKLEPVSITHLYTGVQVGDAYCSSATNESKSKSVTLDSAPVAW